MHTFLKSIGFSEYKYNCDINKLLQLVDKDPDNIEVSSLGDETFITMEKDFAPGVGIGIFGEYDEADRFQIEYFYPYYHINESSTTTPLKVSRHMDRNAFAAMGEDFRLGFALIFYLQNINGYLDLVEKEIPLDGLYEVSLSCLSNEGSILLPIAKTEMAKQKAAIALQEQKRLVQSVLEGDNTAVERLNLHHMELFQSAAMRVKKEDVNSIVESFFLPTGMECDLYRLMGEITAVEELINSLTREKIWKLTLYCNDITIGVLINDKDLEGEPAVGRRFKGDVWLQGNVKFPEV